MSLYWKLIQPVARCGPGSAPDPRFQAISALTARRARTGTSGISTARTQT